MTVSKAHIKASNKYNKENYRKLQANIKPADHDLIEQYSKAQNLSKTQIIVRAVKYCAEHDIDLNMVN